MIVAIIDHFTYFTVAHLKKGCWRRELYDS